jgi:hypothetical protein
MDRRLVGFIALILVITTMISVALFRVEEEEPVRLLSHRTPQSIPGGRPGSPSYSFDVIATKALPDLILRCHFLRKLEDIPLAKGWNETQGREPDDLIANAPRVRHLRAALENLSTDMDSDSYRMLEIDREGSGYLVLFDFTDSAEILAGEEKLHTIYTAYGFEVKADGNVSVYAGYRDFFFDKDRIVTEIRMSTEVPGAKLGSSCYRSEKAPGGMGDCQAISDSPVGILRFQEVSKDQKIHVEVTLNTQPMFGHRGLLQVITAETGYGYEPMLVQNIGWRAG